MGPISPFFCLNDFLTLTCLKNNKNKKTPKGVFC